MVEADLVERRHRGITPGHEVLDDVLQRHGGVLQRLQRHPRHLVGQLPEGRIGQCVGAQQHGVHEHADQTGRLCLAPPGDRHPHHDIGLAAKAGKQRGVGAEQDRELGHAQPARQPRDPLGHLGRNLEPDLGAGVVLHGSAWAVRWHRVHRWCAGQASAPVGQLLFHPGRRELLGPLPDGPVGVLDAQFRQARRPPCHRTRADLGQLGVENPPRGAVADRVVADQH